MEERKLTPIVSEEYKRKKKNEILMSALKCFAKKGFQVATIEDIVTHSGISKGAIYNYFSSKDEIYLELMNQHTEENFKKISDRLNNYHTAKDKLSFLFDSHQAIDPYDENHQDLFLVHFEFWLYSSRDEQLIEMMKERGSQYFLKMIIDIIEEGKSSGEFKHEVDSNVIANMFWTVIDGAALHTLVENNYPYKEVMDAYKKMIFNMLGM